MIHITQAEHDAFTAAVAERDRLLALTAWLPIDTAPKDRTEIDVWVDGERVPDVFFSIPMFGGKKSCWCKVVYDNSFGWVPESVGEPSLWMPKPTPPKVAP